MRISKHHYAVELAEKGNKVFFIEPPNLHNKRIRIRACEDHPNIKIVSYKPLFRGKRYLPDFLYRVLVRIQVYLICRVAGVHPDIVWAFDPCRLENLKWFRASIAIFHAVDLFTTDDLPAEVYTADICFCSSNAIADLVLKSGKPTYFINHGLNKYFCNRARELLDRLEGNRVPYNRKVKVGYSGNLLLEGNDRIIMQRVITSNPDVDFVFWGQYERSGGNLGAFWDPEVESFINFLVKSNNVELKGPVHPSQLSKEMFEMDMFWLCLDTQRSRICTPAINPHKILEYLSTGKALVSHYLSSYDGSDLLYMLPDQNNDAYPQLFQRVIENLRRGEPANLVQKRLRFALDNEYSRQIGRIEHLINITLF